MWGCPQEDQPSAGPAGHSAMVPSPSPSPPSGPKDAGRADWESNRGEDCNQAGEQPGEERSQDYQDPQVTEGGVQATTWGVAFLVAGAFEAMHSDNQDGLPHCTRLPVLAVSLTRTMSLEGPALVSYLGEPRIHEALPVVSGHNRGARTRKGNIPTYPETHGF